MCGEELGRRRRDAVYCSGACKQFAFRRREKATSAALVASKPAEATITVPVPAIITIRDIGNTPPRRESPPPAVPFLA